MCGWLASLSLPYLLGRMGAASQGCLMCLHFCEMRCTAMYGKRWQIRGGFRELVSRSHENESIELELKLRQTSTSILEFRIEIGVEDVGPVIRREQLLEIRANGESSRLVAFANGQGLALPDGQLTCEERTLASPDIFAIQGLGQIRNFSAACTVRNWIEKWHLARLEPGCARCAHEQFAFRARRLFEDNPESFNRILQQVRVYQPRMNEVSPKVTSDGHLTLRFRDGSLLTPFVGRNYSDGEIRLFAQPILLHDRQSNSLLCLEGPELSIYPTLLPELVEEFRSSAIGGGQLMVTTHSTELLKAV
jgi:predicted ATPase